MKHEIIERLKTKKNRVRKTCWNKYSWGNKYRIKKIKNRNNDFERKTGAGMKWLNKKH